MRSQRYFSPALLTACFLLVSQIAYAQIGPELVPPGLDPDHPVDSYSRNGSKKVIEDWRHEASWELNAGDVVFSAAKKRQLISEAPSTIHVITDREISAHGWRTLAEILRHVPGVQTLTTKSQFQSVMIRGLVGTEDNNSRILWLQNGVPMNDVRDSGIWLDETYPVELIKRIEVVLGPGSALYGAGAFQGVVNIFTKDPQDINKYGEYRLAFQNNMTFKASAIAAYTSDDGKLGILGHVAGNTTQGPGLIGDYVYTNYAMAQAGTNVAASQGATDLRANSIESNSEKHWYNINFKLNYGSFKWNLGFTDIYAGADGNEFVPNSDYSTIDDKFGEVSGENIEILDSKKNPIDIDRYFYHFNRREFFTDLIYEDSFGDNVSFLALLSYRMNHYQNKNYRNYRDADELNDYLINEKDDLTAYKDKINYDTMQHKLYALAQVQWRIYEANELIAGLVFEYQHIKTPEFMNGEDIPLRQGDDTPAERWNATTLGQVTPSIFIQDEQRVWNDRIILTAGLRFDAYRVYITGNKDPDYAPSWRFAFLAKWTDWMTMRLSYGFSFKEPSLYQLYINTFDYIGNTKLDSEKLHNVELSFLFTPIYFMKIRLDGFYSHMQNLIIMKYDDKQSINILGESARYTPDQSDGANIGGFELSLDTTIGQNWNIYAHYNFLYGKIDRNGDDNGAEAADINNNIQDDARHRIKLGATYTNDYLVADLALFMVADTPETKSNSNWNSRQTYSTPFYAILQPEITIGLPADLGLMLQGSYAFSEGFDRSPTAQFYYEKEGVPVSRYSVMFSLLYPFKK